MEFGVCSRKEFVGEIAKKGHITYEMAGYLFNIFSEVMEDKLRDGKEVLIPYVGRFHFPHKKASVSNMTKQEVPPHHQVKFRINRNLSRSVRTRSREY